MHFKAFLYVCFCIFAFNTILAKTYTKNYYDSGELKSEGWIDDNSKSGYWLFYYKNGKVSEQGHYKNNKKDAYWHYFSKHGKPTKAGNYIKGKKSKWWLFYDSKGFINHKCQLSMGIKNGYCLKYINQKLTSAEKYKDGQKIKEWFSFSSFRSENKLSDLR
ncbi:hypothetical protein KO500_03555 [Cellulophaga baltica]|uniref:toxin-antitoxin system YwqK family antitoxin n=1 Tax=Cellulophaga TaxID=104264 RepID=UPI001C064F12|nr:MULTISPECIES: hypothetical protein [Cellulophaga]MBU2995489.1 hypothetical protein [Cellulophaga baltica]MDO6766883.1 hypothetical protein [Cellulophaga sp. 1_MG-2023]